MNKIYKKNNYIIITGPDIISEFPITNIYVDKKELTNEYYIYFNSVTSKCVAIVNVPNILKENNTPYTQEEWETFYTVNTGFFFNVGGGGGDTGAIPSDQFVETYSDLPDPTTVIYQIWIVKNSEGTSWLPGSLGGTYYPEGGYASDGIKWVYHKDSYQASQLEVDAGVVTNKWITPFTFENASKWLTKLDESQVQAIADAKVSDIAYDVSWDGVTNIAPSKDAVYEALVVVDQSLIDLTSSITYALGLAMLRENNGSDIDNIKTFRANLGVDKITSNGNSNYNILLTDKVVVTSASFSTSRTWTLPQANTVNPGYEIIVADLFGGVSSTNTLVISRSGSDTINGTTSLTIGAQFGMRRFISDGVNKWNFDAGIMRISDYIGTTLTDSRVVVTDVNGKLTNGITASFVDFTSSGQTQINNKQDRSLSTYSLVANNTNVTANGASFSFRKWDLATYGGTITWNGTAPNTILGQSYGGQQVGNMVSLSGAVVYSNAGATNTQVTFTLPSDFPIPISPTGFTGALDIVAYGIGMIATTTTSTAVTGARACFLRRNAANNGYEIVLNISTSLSARVATFNITYQVS